MKKLIKLYRELFDYKIVIKSRFDMDSDEAKKIVGYFSSWPYLYVYIKDFEGIEITYP